MNEAADRIAVLYERHARAWDAERPKALIDHASLSGGDYRALLSANGFATVAHVAEDPDCGRHTVWLARRAG